MRCLNIHSKQLSALTFCAASVPSVMLLANYGWLWGTAAAAVSVALVLLVQSRPPICSKVFKSLLLVWNLLALGAGANLLCSIFPHGNDLTGLLLLLAATYAASRERNVLLRIGAVCLFLHIILYSMLLGFSLPDLTGENFAAAAPSSFLALSASLTPMLAALLRKEEEKVQPWSLVAFLALTLLAALVTAGSRDFYTAMMSVSLFGVMERLEPLVSVVLTAGGFCLMGMICSLNKSVLEDLHPQRKNFAPVLNFIVGAVGIYLSRYLGGAFYAVGTAIFWGALPTLAQSLENSKNFKKN